MLQSKKILFIVLFVLILLAVSFFIFILYESSPKEIINDSTLERKQVLTELEEPNISQEENEKKINPYPYRKTFINPFIDVQGGGVLTSKERVKQTLSFDLVGILGNDNKRLAIIRTEDGEQIYEVGDEIDQAIIRQINSRKIVVEYEGFNLDLTINKK